MKFHSKAIAEHDEAPLGDDGRLEELVSQWIQKDANRGHALGGSNDCYVVAASLGLPVKIDEIIGLVDAAGDRVVGQFSYEVRNPDPRTLVGKGVAERIGRDARAQGANMIVIDAELTPSQARNLEDHTGLAICDREAVILNVFQRHATTKRARMQVELAHLAYLRPRIRGIGLNMDQQSGGLNAARGPGETASELLARQIDGRLALLRRALRRSRVSDEVQRRQRRDCRRIALVGYTNAGKTSLMNALTASELSVRNRPFETLDITSRSLTRHGGTVLLSDTVGFIRRLPKSLFESFASTLAEAREADLLVVVLDLSDPELPLHARTIEDVLTTLDAASIPRFIVFNKVDNAAAPFCQEQLESWAEGYPYLAVSSHDGTQVDALREALLQLVRNDDQRVELLVPYENTALTVLIYRGCRVLEAEPRETAMRFVIEGPTALVAEIVRTHTEAQL